MENNILLAIAIILFVALLISLFFLFRKKETSSTKTLIEQEINTAKIIEEVKLKETILKEEKFEKVVSELQAKIEADKIEAEKQIIIQQEAAAKEEPIKSNVNIASKTEKQLLKKLEQFEKNEVYLKKDITLNSLSKQFNTNTKYLSEIIKSYKNKNFNQYINELRINHLIEKLQTDEKVLNTKVSFLANDFGFNSHSSFSTLFTQYVGKSPSDYIKELKAVKKAEQTA